MQERSRRMQLGVVLERRDVDNPWIDHAWRALEVIPGASADSDWREIERGEGWVHYLAATLPLELHRKETEAYKVNLANQPPVIYVVLRPEEEAGALFEVAPFLVTASAFEAQDYLDTGEEQVDGVPMSPGLVAWVEDFVEAHHVDVPFKKRKRRNYDPDAAGFGAQPGQPGFDRKQRKRNGGGRG